MSLTVTEPGVYGGIPDDVYHADPVPGGSLSVSGARQLLPPSCPARFAYERAHGRPPKAEFDLGHAAHRLALGAGPELEVVDAPDWRTKAARERRDKAREAGLAPVLTDEYEAVTGMVAALRAHPIAAELLNPATMRPEVSIFWRDQLYPDVWRRARIDAVSSPDDHVAPTIVDYKTCRSADPEHIARAMWDYGYAMQADWYLDGAGTVGLVPDGGATFLFVFQEIRPPYLVTVAEPDPAALRIGRQRNRAAIDVYRECTAAGRWPGYVPDDDIPLIGLPGWIERQHTTTDYDEEIL